MRYCPVLVRLTPLQPTHVPHALSGFLVDDGNMQYGITISPLPAAQLSNYRLHVAAAHTRDDVVWARATVLRTIPVFAGDNEKSGLFSFLDTASRSGFNFFPTDSLGGVQMKDICVVQLSCYVQDTIYSGFQMGRARPLSSLRIQSSPFGLTNPKLFADFRSLGGVCAVFADGYLSDCRYLENMVGGMVSDSESNLQVGIVLGNLRKMNGDGDLTVVLALEALEMIFPKAAPNPTPLKQATLLPAGDPPKLALSRVLPLTFSSEACSLWGTCVVYNENTLVTNYHVVQPLLERENVTCHVLVEGGNVLVSRKEVVVPFEALDLAFILCAGILFEVAQLRSSTHADVVFAAGFGLFLNKRRLEPLVTSGAICRTTELCPFGAGASIPCMMITSTLCWNGSSGGGVFDAAGDFVGLISSNAQVYMPEIGGEAPKRRTEKVPLFCFTIPAALVAKCYEEKVLKCSDVQLSEKVRKAWSLDSYYTEIFQHEAKL